MKPRSILYVDDSAVARAAAARLLGARGLAATILGSLREAAGIDPATVSCALLDLELGDGFGTELAERLRGDAPSLPIAFLTAGATNGEVERARRIGPIFEKPAGLSDAVSWLVDAESAAPP